MAVFGVVLHETLLSFFSAEAHGTSLTRTNVPRRQRGIRKEPYENS